MTNNEALQLIYDSSPWQLAMQNGEGAPGAWRRWQASNPLEASKLLRYAGGAITRPTLGTKYGRGMVELVSRSNYAQIPAIFTPDPAPPVPPTPPPPVTDPFWDVHTFGQVTVANNASADLMRNAGITAVAFEFNAGNYAEWGSAKWNGFVRGGFHTTWTKDLPGIDAECASLAVHYATDLLDFLLIDTEQLKADHPNEHYMGLQAALWKGLRDRLPAARIANITYGWHQDGSVVNYPAMKQYGIVPWWEAYNGDAASWDLVNVVAKVNGLGFKPARICMGHKMLPSQTVLLSQAMAQGNAAQGSMVWGCDLGEAIEAFAQGVKIP